MRVIITRPLREASKWVSALNDTGYDAIALPLIEVAAAPDAQVVQAAGQRLVEYDGVMFVSGNAVDHFFGANPALAPVFNAQSAIKTRALATGPGTVASLLRAHAELAWIDAPDRESEQFDSEALWAVIAPKVSKGYRVLIVRGTGASGQGGEGYGRDWFAKQVVAAGGQVDFVVAYQRVSVPMDNPTRQLAQAAAADGSVWLFSSSEAIANLMACCPSQDWSLAKAVVTHPRIGQAAQTAGFGLVRESRPSLPALMASIESLQ